ncbi:MAG: pyruvate kinase [Nanoarchaeota archaeon]|nr:pyruvate kinase [Nanoarchaeota archaeon]MBU1005200.1 pyruvate kinase [Nanoarchaeota archaeon]MBU1946871.1 pyruvate kinase [Nanoarchaeota archaeon]
MIRTKIICTIGPASDSVDMIEKLAKAGMNIARLNFSHSSYDEHLDRIKKINDINSKRLAPVGIMLDTRGPEIRLGNFKHPVILIKGDEITITTTETICDDKIISVSYKNLHKQLKVNDLIYISDGTIELKVKKITGNDILCEVIEGGEVNSRKNVSVPGVIVDLPSIDEKDIRDIEFGAKNQIDFVAQSWVRSAKDVIDLKNLLKKNNSGALIIAKIECLQGIKNIDQIIAAADGIMVARGDLGVQIPIEQVPNAQKMIIRKCNRAGKPVIVATQMLESMTKNPRPTRAEVTDVANAIIDGTDAIMLSGETAIGKFPLKAVEMMQKIANQIEPRMDFKSDPYSRSKLSIEDSLSKNVCQTAHEVKAKAIITCTLSGHTAKVISRKKPTTTIIAVTPKKKEIKKLNLWWGVHPLLIEKPKSADSLMENAIDLVLKRGLIKRGDIVVITAGIPFTTPGNMNMMKVQIVK